MRSSTAPAAALILLCVFSSAVGSDPAPHTLPDALRDDGEADTQGQAGSDNTDNGLELGVSRIEDRSAGSLDKPAPPGGPRPEPASQPTPLGLCDGS
jgi:hypothetical protein